LLGVCVEAKAEDVDEIWVKASSSGRATIRGGCSEQRGEVVGCYMWIGRVDEDATDELCIIHDQSAPWR
jgi:hypothetical protein